MTRGGYLPPMERWRRDGGRLVVGRITDSGQVILVSVETYARKGQRSTLELWPLAAWTTVLGRVDPDDPCAWRTAETMIRGTGWRPAEEWTTVARQPAVRLEPDPNASRGTVPRGN